MHCRLNTLWKNGGFCNSLTFAKMYDFENFLWFEMDSLPKHGGPKLDVQTRRIGSLIQLELKILLFLTL